MLMHTVTPDINIFDDSTSALYLIGKSNWLLVRIVESALASAIKY